MKSYTDLEQSKKLTEILPFESADMYYSKHDTIHADALYVPCDIQSFTIYEHIPCWSLAALLEEIPDTLVNNDGEDLKLHIQKDNLQYYLLYENEYSGDMFEIETEIYDDMVDACYEMIMKLKEMDLL